MGAIGRFFSCLATKLNGGDYMKVESMDSEAPGVEKYSCFKGEFVEVKGSEPSSSLFGFHRPFRDSGTLTERLGTN